MSIAHPSSTQKLLFLLFVLLLAMVFAEKAHAAAYMKLGDIKGDVSSSDHRDWILVESVAVPSSLNTAISTATSAAKTDMSAVTSESSARKRQYEPIRFTKRIDKSSPMLQKAATEGTVFTSATLDAPDPNDPAQPLRIELENVLITSYQTSGSAGSTSVPMESFSLNYEKIIFTKLPKTKKTR